MGARQQLGSAERSGFGGEADPRIHGDRRYSQCVAGRTQLRRGVMEPMNDELEAKLRADYWCRPFRHSGK